MSDVVVIGAGLAGLTAAARLAQGGAQVTLLATGLGGLQLSQGTIDVVGYASERVTDVDAGLAAIVAGAPDHPYARLGGAAVGDAVDWFVGLLGPDRLAGDGATNLQLPTAVGALRPTAYAPPSMLAGNVHGDASVLIVGFPRIKDFHPGLVADNLTRGGVRARAVQVDVVARAGEVDSSGLTFARAMDDAAFRRTIADAIAPHVGPQETIGLPAVLGLRDAHAAWRDLEERLGHRVFEIPLPPPSVPGMRLNAALTEIARDAGVRLVVGSPVIGATWEHDRLASVQAETAGRTRTYHGDAFVFAPGGFESGAIAVDSHGTISEPALGLPLVGVPDGAPVEPDYWADHALFRVGIATDAEMRVTGADGGPVARNLVAAGGILAGATRWREKSGEGIAIASAVRAADTIIGASRG